MKVIQGIGVVAFLVLFCLVANLPAALVSWFYGTQGEWILLILFVASTAVVYGVFWWQTTANCRSCKKDDGVSIWNKCIQVDDCGSG